MDTLCKTPNLRPTFALFGDDESVMDLSNAKLTLSTERRCVACGHRAAEFTDPQRTGRHVSTPEPELCSTCHVRILEAQASKIALDLHAALSAMGATAGAPASAVLQSIESWLELPLASTDETGTVVIGQF